MYHCIELKIWVRVGGIVVGCGLDHLGFESSPGARDFSRLQTAELNF